MPLTCEKKGLLCSGQSQREINGLCESFGRLVFLFYFIFFILTVTVRFLLLAVKWPKIFVLAVTSTPPSRPSDKFLLISDNSFLTRDIKFQEKI